MCLGDVLALPLQAKRHASREDMEATYLSVRRSKSCKLTSYRVGVVLIITVAALLTAGIVVAICEAIDTLHTGRY